MRGGPPDFHFQAGFLAIGWVFRFITEEQLCEISA